MNKDLIAVYLELAAAKAKQLAIDVKAGRLWPGDLSRGICEAREALDKAMGQAGNDR